MLGAIAGDIVGSRFEGRGRQIKTTQFELFNESSRFTDDTVLSVAVVQAILEGLDYALALELYAQRYPKASYGGAFYHWAHNSESSPYNSWGNGSAMRVSPVGWAFDTVDDVLVESERSAQVTHNHPEGIKGAFEFTIRNAISLGGDSDTMACIAGAISEAFYGGVPELLRLLQEELSRRGLRQTATRTV